MNELVFFLYQQQQNKQTNYIIIVLHPLLVSLWIGLEFRLVDSFHQHRNRFLTDDKIK